MELQMKDPSPFSNHISFLRLFAFKLMFERVFFCCLYECLNIFTLLSDLDERKCLIFKPNFNFIYF